MKKLLIGLLASLLAFGASAQTFTVNQIFSVASISGSSNQGAYNYGTLPYMDTGVIEMYSASVNGYVQNILQNSSNGTSASADFIVNNNLSTATTYYGDFGINSSTFVGTGSLNLPNATYLAATSGDLVLGTTTSNAIHIVPSSSATDAITISSSGVVTIPQTIVGSVNGNAATATTATTATSATTATTATNLSGGSVAATTITGNSVVVNPGTPTTTEFQVGSGSSTSAGMYIGQTGSSGFGGLWSTSVTPSASNYVIAANGSTSYFSAPTTGVLGIQGSSIQVANWNSTGITIYTGQFKPLYPNGIAGITTGAALNAGAIGQTITATGTAVSLTTATNTNITSIALTAGNWSITATIYFTPAGTTTTTIEEAGISSTTATLPAIPLYTYMPMSLAAGVPIAFPLPSVIVNTSGTPTYYCVAQATFAVSTETATCTITAVRVS